MSPLRTATNLPGIEPSFKIWNAFSTKHKFLMDKWSLKWLNLHENWSDHNVGSDDSWELIRKTHKIVNQWKREWHAWTDTTQTAMNEIWAHSLLAIVVACASSSIPRPPSFLLFHILNSQRNNKRSSLSHNWIAQQSRFVDHFTSINGEVMCVFVKVFASIHVL